MDLSAELSGKDKIRWEVLREWRKQYADEHDVPAFVVFSDKTLRDLVQKNPTSLADLGAVYGFGAYKVEHLGALVLEQLGWCG